MSMLNTPECLHLGDGDVVVALNGVENCSKFCCHGSAETFHRLMVCSAIWALFWQQSCNRADEVGEQQHSIRSRWVVSLLLLKEFDLGEAAIYHLTIDKMLLNNLFASPSLHFAWGTHCGRIVLPSLLSPMQSILPYFPSSRRHIISNVSGLRRATKWSAVEEDLHAEYGKFVN